MTGQAGYTIRKAAYDLRKLLGKHLAGEPRRIRRYLISAGAARIVSALLSENRSSRPSSPVPPTRRTPRHWTGIDRHYQALRLQTMALFAGVGIACG